MKLSQPTMMSIAGQVLFLSYGPGSMEIMIAVYETASRLEISEARYLFSASYLDSCYTLWWGVADLWAGIIAFSPEQMYGSTWWGHRSWRALAQLLSGQ